MALYEYHCSACDRTFTVFQSVDEHGRVRVTCPQCRSSKVEQVLSSFYAKTVRKS
jgi:putative FmdB family regulatory protein